MQMTNISERVFNTPLLISPAKATAILNGLGPRITGRNTIEIAGEDGVGAKGWEKRTFASILDNSISDQIRIGKRDGYAIKDGIAIIPITGVLVHRGAWLGESSGQQSYEGISAQVETAMEDTRARGIALEIDSPGGEVAGCFELAELIKAARDKKPVWAFVAELAYSSAYALASQASRIVLPKSGGVGSIGCYWLHLDQSVALAGDGLKVTPVFAGAHKVDGNSFEPLSEDLRATFTAELEAVRSIFADTVAAGRSGRINMDAVLSTEAKSYLAAEAVALGLADEVIGTRAAFQKFKEEVNGQNSISGLFAQTERSGGMSQKPETTKAEDAVAPAESTDDASTDVQSSESSAQPVASETTADPQDERARCAAILGSDEAEGRTKLAQHLAFKTDLSAEAAVAALAEASKGNESGALAQAMADDESNLGTTPDASAQVRSMSDAMNDLLN